MKVLFISNDPSLFEADSAARARMRAYAAAIGEPASPEAPRGELHVLSRAPEDVKGEQEGPLFLHPFAGGRLSALCFMARRAHRIVQAHGIDIVSAQDPFEYGWIACRAVFGTSAKLHIQVHTDFLSPWFTRSGNVRSLKVPMPFLNRIRAFMAGKTLRSADGIRAVSERVKSSLVGRYGNRIPEPVVIPFAVPSEPPAPAPLPQLPFSFSFITVGRLEPEKRIEDILMALGRLGPRLHSVGLVVIGEGRERRRLGTLARKLGLERRVFFAGARSDAWGLMRSAHAYVQASAYEGYGRTLIEAALARLPIITTDVGIVGEVFKGYEDVLSTPVADPANLAAHMNRLIGDHHLRLVLAQKAERAAREHLAALADEPSAVAAALAALITPLHSL